MADHTSDEGRLRMDKALRQVAKQQGGTQHVLSGSKTNQGLGKRSEELDAEKCDPHYPGGMGYDSGDWEERNWESGS